MYEPWEKECQPTMDPNREFLHQIIAFLVSNVIPGFLMFKGEANG
jgi:hypothetical protein